MITGENFIGFKRSSKGHIKYRTTNPKLNTENEWEFSEATVDEINEAMSLAVEAFNKYKTYSGNEKAKFLRAIAEEIEALGDELIDVFCKETALPEGRAMGERGRTTGQLRKFADYVEEGSWVEATIDQAEPDREPMPKSDIRKMSVPIGPITVFGASNFPLAFSTAGGDTASALAAGCPVIVKSHPMHAATAELVASAVIKAAEKTNLPEGIFSLLNSKDQGVGKTLVMHPDLKGVGFTGSLQGGRALHDLASLRPKPIPVFAEMGSINPIVLLPEKLKNDSNNLATSIANSITLGAGQFCTNPGVLIGIKDESFDTFQKHLQKVLSEIEPNCMLHPNIAKTFNKNKQKVTGSGNVELLYNHTDVDENYASQGLTKVNAKTFIANKELHEEVFGPFSMLVECNDLEELTRVVSCLNGQLTGTIMGTEEEISQYSELVEILKEKVGRLVFNGVPTGVEVCQAMFHGGPYPASTDSRFTAVGNDAIKRWVRPVCYQDFPENMLPPELQNGNPLNIWRIVDGERLR